MDTLRTYSMFAFIVLGAGTLQVFWFLRALLCFGFEEKKKWKNGFGESEVIEQSAVSWTTTIQMHTASLCFIAVTWSTIVRFVFFFLCLLIKYEIPFPMECQWIEAVSRKYLHFCLWICRMKKKILLKDQHSKGFTLFNTNFANFRIHLSIPFGAYNLYEPPA